MVRRSTTLHPSKLSTNRGVSIGIGSSTFGASVLKLGSKVISLLLLFVIEPRSASAVLSFNALFL